MYEGEKLYLGELHLPGHNLTGPFTKLDKRLDKNNNPLPHSISINRIDEASLRHDLTYYNKNLNSRHEADRKMLEELKNIDNPTIREKIERFIVSKIISLKVKVFNKGDLFSADLVFMPKDKSYQYILTVIDVYTRYAWCKPLFLKSDTLKAFKEILSESNRIPKKLWVDKGTEFYNKNFKAYLKEHSIEMYSTENAGKAVVIERFNRTIEEWLWRKFTEQQNQKWVKILPELVDIYNHKIHRSIKVSPIEASNNPQKIKDITNTNNFYNENNYPQKKPKFKIKDRVRIFKY